MMQKVFLIRVGMDSTYGGFVSPIFPDGTYVFIPIPNIRKGQHQIDTDSENLKTYSEVKTNSDIPLTDYLPKDKIVVKGDVFKDIMHMKVHNDPEFETMTYGEMKSKFIYGDIRDFTGGDYIVFYATFFPCAPDFKYKEYTLSQLQNKQRGNKQYYIFAFLKLKYPPIDRSNYKRYEDEIKNNAHYLGNVLSFVTHLEHQQFLPGPNVICDVLSHARCSFYVLLTLLRFYRQR